MCSEPGGGVHGVFAEAVPCPASYAAQVHVAPDGWIR